VPVFTRPCDHCGGEYQARRSTSRFCSPAHRSAASRVRNATPEVEADAEPAATSAPSALPSAVYVQTRHELEQADRLASVEGQSALALARSIDAGGESGSALVSLVRGLRETLELALAGQVPVQDPKAGTGQPDPIDLAKERRERRRSAAK
jgi:hypothetical protein